MIKLLGKAVRIFSDVISGKKFELAGLNELIDHAR